MTDTEFVEVEHNDGRRAPVPVGALAHYAAKGWSPVPTEGETSEAPARFEGRGQDEQDTTEGGSSDDDDDEPRGLDDDD